MRISIIGASAGIGIETLKRALQRGHDVTTLSRSSISHEQSSSYHTILGDATNREDLIAAIKNAEAVIITLGTGKNMKATTLFSDFAKLLVDIQNEYHFTAPFLFVTGFGTGESKNYTSWFVKLFLTYFLNEVYADKAKMEETIAGSNLNWMILRPGRLFDKPLTEKYRIETELFKGIKISGINRADVADFLVKQAENPTYLLQRPAISEK